MCSPRSEGNFCDEHGKDVKLAIVQGYNRHGVFEQIWLHDELLLY
jgi:hypothetical protein